MKIQENKKSFVLFYMLGFLAGILYANFISRDYITSAGIFSEFFLNQYAQTDLNVGEYAWYVVRIRVTPLILLCALGCTRLKKTGVILFMLWTGLSSGLLMTSAVMKMGIKGIILCLMGITPQFIFYVAGYLILLWFLYTYPQSKWNLSKTVCFILFMSVGVILECYVNPILMKMFLRTL